MTKYIYCISVDQKQSANISIILWITTSQLIGQKHTHLLSCTNKGIKKLNWSLCRIVSRKKRGAHCESHNAPQNAPCCIKTKVTWKAHNILLCAYLFMGTLCTIPQQIVPVFDPILLNPRCNTVFIIQIIVHAMW